MQVPIRPSPAGARADEPEDLARYVRGVAGTVLVTLSMLAAWHVLRRRPGLRQERLEAFGGSRSVAGDDAGAIVVPESPESGIDLDLGDAAGDADAQHLILADAELFIKLGRPESAIGLLRSEIDRSPDSPRLWEALAKLLGSLSRSRELDALIAECRRRAGPDMAERIASARGLLRQ